MNNLHCLVGRIGYHGCKTSIWGPLRGKIHCQFLLQAYSDLPNAVERLSCRVVRVSAREQKLASCCILRIIFIQETQIREGHEGLPFTISQYAYAFRRYEKLTGTFASSMTYLAPKPVLQ